MSIVNISHAIKATDDLSTNDVLCLGGLCMCVSQGGGTDMCTDGDACIGGWPSFPPPSCARELSFWLTCVYVCLICRRKIRRWHSHPDPFHTGSRLREKQIVSIRQGGIQVVLSRRLQGNIGTKICCFQKLLQKVRCQTKTRYKEDSAVLFTVFQTY